MVDRALPNPSFYVLDISDRSQVGNVSTAIVRNVEHEEGGVLTWIGGTRYTLSRPAMKKLARGKTPEQLSDFLGGLAFVRRVSRERAGDVVQAYNDRRILPSGHGVEASLPKQWNLECVKAEDAWNKLGGLDGDMPWRRVRIGHLDTGYTFHPVLGFDGSGVSPFVKGDEGINFFDDGGLPIDPLRESGTPGHGTRTMSVLNGYVQNHFHGVAPKATVIPYRVTDFVGVDTLWNKNPLDRAIEHAVFQSRCKVLSISLGDPCFPPGKVGRAIDRAYKAGVIVVAAAGNVTSEVTFPGRYARTIAVGGVTEADCPWSGGSRGSRVDISAPADDVFRATVERVGGGFEYAYGPGGDGTSYATVHVSAAAAMWLAFHERERKPIFLTYRGWEIVEAFRWCLRNSARTPHDWNEGLFGTGILNIDALLSEPLPSRDGLVFEGDLAADDIG